MSDDDSVHVIDDVTVVYKWLIVSSVGDKLSLNWTIRCQHNSTATLRVRINISFSHSIT